ncbi:MAG TPA: ATP-binding cassette domain-containing protein, partial [Cyclobacteriaceae bacterium]
MSGGTAIRVENLGKKFVIGHRVEGDLRGSFSRRLSRLMGRSGEGAREEFWALKDVSFEVRKGEAVGIIGRNGAGKSTLLKILSRITDPSTGRFEIAGRVSSLLEVGTGFHSELTGRENIYLNGTILGMRRAEIRKKFDAIVDFSGVEKFLDTPV